MRAKDLHIELGGSGIEADYAALLLRGLGFAPELKGGNPSRHPADAWARSGAMALTGLAGGPALVCPAPLASCAAGAARALSALAPDARAFDGAVALGMRAAFAGFTRNGAIAPGGACRLLEAMDGMLAINLAREDDWSMLPAWLEETCASDWTTLAERVRRKSRDVLVARGHLLGLAVAPDVEPLAAPWFRMRVEGPNAVEGRVSPLVIDLSALWAGPLAAQLLRRTGARVIKVESRTRPDGARLGPAAFFEMLNRGKEQISLDFQTERGALRALIEEADIVIEASRPRALRQLGIDAEQLVRARPGLVWLSLTGYGRDAPEADWIAFGDDAGVAAGLSHIMREAHGQPLFCADAIADPLAGLHAALAALALWMQGRGGLIALALRDVAAHCALFRAPKEGWRAREQAWSAYLAAQGISAAAPQATPC